MEQKKTEMVMDQVHQIEQEVRCEQTAGECQQSGGSLGLISEARRTETMIMQDAGLSCEEDRSMKSPDQDSGYGGTSTTDGTTTPPLTSRETSSNENSPDKKTLAPQDEAGSECSATDKNAVNEVSSTPGRKKLIMDPAAADTDRPRDTLADFAEYVADGREQYFASTTGKERDAEWLRAVHDKLLKRVLNVQNADASDEQSCVPPPCLPAGDRVIADRMLIRSGADGDHVLLMGSVTMILDPLGCPFAFLGQCPEKFCTADCRDLKAHLQGMHGLNNVKINLLCPFSDETGGEQCREIIYDPLGLLAYGHVKKAHPDFKEEIALGLCYGYGQAEATKAGSLEQKLYRKKLPRWVLELKDKLPSQDIPEMICNPTFIQDKELHYECGAGCRDLVFGTHEGIICHLMEQHQINPSQTEVMHACPAVAKECPVTLFWGSTDMLMHVEACHAEMLGMSTDYSDDAIKKRKELERDVEKTAKRLKHELAVARRPNGSSLQRVCAIPCPVPGCRYKEYEEALIIWHIGAAHRDIWNVA